MFNLDLMDDVSRYQVKYGPLTENFALPVDPEAMDMIRELRRLGVNVNAFSRDVLIPKLRELYQTAKGSGPKAA